MVLRPTVDVRPSRPAAVQARAAAEFLGATYADSTALVLGVRAVLDEIVSDEERTDQAGYADPVQPPCHRSAARRQSSLTRGFKVVCRVPHDVPGTVKTANGTNRTEVSGKQPLKRTRPARAAKSQASTHVGGVFDGARDQG